MNIRAATAADIPAIRDIESQADTAAHWSRQQYEEVFADSAPHRCVWVIEDATTIHGFLVAKAVTEEWEIENIAVAAQARRQGLASQLLGAWLNQVRAEKAAAVFLEVRVSNAPARALYKKIGFVETGRRKDYYRDPSEDAVVYHLLLPTLPHSCHPATHSE